jgi:hypothetical protein
MVRALPKHQISPQVEDQRLDAPSRESIEWSEVASRIRWYHTKDGWLPGMLFASYEEAACFYPAGSKRNIKISGMSMNPKFALPDEGDRVRILFLGGEEKNIRMGTCDGTMRWRPFSTE